MDNTIKSPLGTVSMYDEQDLPSFKTIIGNIFTKRPFKIKIALLKALHRKKTVITDH